MREGVNLAKFSVLCRVDAFVDYVAEVQANSAKEAAAKAYRNAESLVWKPDGTAEFDARLYVTLDDDGFEIDGTQQGDF